MDHECRIACSPAASYLNIITLCPEDQSCLPNLDPRGISYRRFAVLSVEKAQLVQRVDVSSKPRVDSKKGALRHLAALTKEAT
ncbi:hypothetical protein RJZ57_005279 [Blastomyces gilchristii]